MTQRQIDAPMRLPRCRLGHAARLIHDMRCAKAGGGYFIECACGATTKHVEIDAALQEWKRANRVRTPRPPKPADNILQFNLFASGGRSR